MKEIWMVAHKHTHFLKPEAETRKQWLPNLCVFASFKELNGLLGGFYVGLHIFLLT